MIIKMKSLRDAHNKNGIAGVESELAKHGKERIQKFLATLKSQPLESSEWFKRMVIAIAEDLVKA